MVIEDVIPCEDSHAQKRSLLTQVLPTIRPRDLLIDDRNFCTSAFLFDVKARRAYFITRQHGRMPWTPLGKSRFSRKSSKLTLNRPSRSDRTLAAKTRVCAPRGLLPQRTY
jgi:hypothetical protein